MSLHFNKDLHEAACVKENMLSKGLNDPSDQVSNRILAEVSILERR